MQGQEQSYSLSIIARLAAVSALLVSLNIAPLTGAASADNGDLDRKNALKAQLSSLAKMGTCTMPCFSPDGTSISFISNMSGTFQLWQVPYASGWPHQITAATVPVGGQDWSPTSDRIAYIAGVGDFTIGMTNSDGTDERSYSSLKGSRRLFWSPDGKQLLVAAKADGKEFSPYIIDAENGERMLCGKEADEYPCDLSPDGHTVLLHSVINNFDGNLVLQDLQTAKRHLLTKHEKATRFFGGFLSARCRPRFSSDGKSVYLVTNAGKAKCGFAMLSLDSSREDCPIEFLSSRQDAEVSGFMLDSSRKTALLSWHKEKGGDSVSLFDLETNKEQELPPLPGASLIDMDLSPDGKRIAANVQDELSSQDIYGFENKSNSSWTQITFSQHPGLNLAKLIKPEKIAFISENGKQLKGTLFRASGALPGPCVIGMGMTDLAAASQTLALNGISVFVPEVEDSNEIGKMTDSTAMLRAQLTDLKCFVDYLVKENIAAPGHLGITGHGKYGFFSLAAICQYPDIFAACVERSGWADFSICENNSDKSEAKYFEQDFGSPKRDSEEMKFLSPIAKFDRVKAAVMVQHGAKDRVVPAEAARQIIDNLSKQNKPVESLINKDEGANYVSANNRLEASIALLDFFIRRLK